jgi:hypothetical protein
VELIASLMKPSIVLILAFHVCDWIETAHHSIINGKAETYLTSVLLCTNLPASSVGFIARIIANSSTSRLILKGAKGVLSGENLKMQTTATHNENAGTLFIAAGHGVCATLAIWLTRTDRHYRCCQRNNNSEEREAHCCARWCEVLQ